MGLTIIDAAAGVLVGEMIRGYTIATALVPLAAA